MYNIHRKYQKHQERGTAPSLLTLKQVIGKVSDFKISYQLIINFDYYF